MKINRNLIQAILCVIVVALFYSCNKKCTIDNLSFQTEKKEANEIDFYLKQISHNESKTHMTEPSFVLEVHNFSGKIVDLKKELNDISVSCLELSWSLSFFEKGEMKLKNGDKIFITMVPTKMITYDHQLKLIDCLKESTKELEMKYINSNGLERKISKAKGFNVCIQELEN